MEGIEMQNVKTVGAAWLMQKLNKRGIDLNSPKADYIFEMYKKAVGLDA